MADSYTTRLGLIAMEEGTHSNEWGDLTNLNLNRIDSATRGYTPIVLTTAKTLVANDITTTGDTAEEESFFSLIEFTGAPGAGTIVTVPAEQIMWTVFNNTNDTIVFTPLGGTGLTIASGVTVLAAYRASGTMMFDASLTLNSHAHLAAIITFDNAASGLTAANVQAAIDEVEARVDTAEGTISTNTGNITTANTNHTNHLNDAVAAHAATAISFDDSTAVLGATTVQAAIEAIDTITDNVITTTGGQSIAGTTTINDLNVTTNIDAATLALTGNMTTTGLIDTRDVAADGVIVDKAVTTDGGQSIAGTTTINDLDVTTNIDAATLALTGNMTTTGLIDTRDVAADGVIVDKAITTDGGQTIAGLTVTGTNLTLDRSNPTLLMESSGTGNGKFWDQVLLASDNSLRFRVKDDTNSSVINTFQLDVDGTFTTPNGEVIHAGGGQTISGTITYGTTGKSIRSSSATNSAILVSNDASIALELRGASANGNQLYLNSTNDFVGIGKIPTNGELDVSGTIYQDGDKVVAEVAAVANHYRCGTQYLHDGETPLSGLRIDTLLSSGGASEVFGPTGVTGNAWSELNVIPSAATGIIIAVHIDASTITSAAGEVSVALAHADVASVSNTEGGNQVVHQQFQGSSGNQHESLNFVTVPCNSSQEFQGAYADSGLVGNILTLYYKGYTL